MIGFFALLVYPEADKWERTERLVVQLPFTNDTLLIENWMEEITLVNWETFSLGY